MPLTYKPFLLLHIFPYAFILSYLSHLSRLSLPTAEIPPILYSFVANMNIFFCRRSQPVPCFSSAVSLFLSSLLLPYRQHAIGVLDFVQEEVGPLCNSESSSSLIIKDILIFIRHVTLLNTTAPVASTHSASHAPIRTHTQGNIIRDQCVGTHRTKSTQGNIIRDQCVLPSTLSYIRYLFHFH